MLMLARARTRSCLTSTLPGLIQFGTHKITFRHDSSSSNQRRESHGLAIALFLEKEQASKGWTTRGRRRQSGRACTRCQPVVHWRLRRAQHDRTHGQSTQPIKHAAQLVKIIAPTVISIPLNNQNHLSPTPHPLHSMEPLTKHSYCLYSVWTVAEWAAN